MSIKSADGTPPLTKPSISQGDEKSIPLCLDLDGTLLRSDLLYESLLAMLARNPLLIVMLPVWLLKGKAHLKSEIASRCTVTAANLPYDERIVALTRSAQAQGRQVFLCTASDESLVQPIADHLSLDGIVASDGKQNMAGDVKAEALVNLFGEGKFDYAGNSKVDLAVWKRSRTAIVVGNDQLAAAASQLAPLQAHYPHQAPTVKLWTKAIRVHQWLKNLLIFVPLLASHRFLEWSAVSQTALAFLAFSFCASGVYVLNDLLDLPSDRKHPRKRNRPFAKGSLPLVHGLLAAPLLTLSGWAVACLVSPPFLAVLVLYYSLTVAYSLRLKREAVIDVVTLAALYTMRIIGGAIAIQAELSFWLLAFSMFIFLSLAMLKRYTELNVMLAQGKDKASGRGYTVEDLPLIQSLGASSGYIAVMVLALYINSPESVELYSHPRLIWLVCPLVLYWISRAWLVAHRGLMDDDPIVFASKDRTSQIIGLTIFIIAILAI